MASLVCKSCGVGLDSSHTGPCPACNGTGRLALQDIGAICNAKTSLVVANKSASGVENVRVVNSDGRSSSADHVSGGSWKYLIEGDPPHNEDGTLSACHRLVAHLNTNGGGWRNPTEMSEKGVDCVTHDGSHEVYIQVVRPPDTRVYETLHKSKRFQDEKDAKSLADDLRDAINHKDRKDFPRGRQNTILAIDLADFAAHAVEQVSENFKQHHGKHVKAIGFRSIWAVGPTEQFILRLDDA